MAKYALFRSEFMYEDLTFAAGLIATVAAESYRLKDKRRAGIVARPHNAKEMKEETI